MEESKIFNVTSCDSFANLANQCDSVERIKSLPTTTTTYWIADSSQKTDADNKLRPVYLCVTFLSLPPSMRTRNKKNCKITLQPKKNPQVTCDNFTLTLSIFVIFYYMSSCSSEIYTTKDTCVIKNFIAVSLNPNSSLKCCKTVTYNCGNFCSRSKYRWQLFTIIKKCSHLSYLVHVQKF